LKAISQRVVDLVIPPLCLNCGSRLDKISDLICDDCLGLLEPVDGDLCPKCGTPMEEKLCAVCADTEFHFSLARAPWMFSGPVQVLIHKLKYDLYLSPVPFLARGMHTAFLSEPAFSGADVITAVPLHHTRKRERTFNQSELLAQTLSSSTGIPYADLVRRKIYTSSQTKLSKTKRQNNLRGAFAPIGKTAASYGKVILVDDVFTTGSTVNEVSQVLLDSGVKEVLVLTAARAG
jgi:ComF family protein